MAGANSTLQCIEKLKGIDNYSTWKFTMKMLLIHEDLWECIEGEEKDTKKTQKALARICLSVNTCAFPHVRNAKSAQEAWINLSKAYEDKGLCRRLGLLRTLFSIKLTEHDSMESYLGKLQDLSQQLQDINSPLDDEFLAVIMLSGLPNNYDPLIMALENSNMKLSSDMVKGKLLQEYERRDKSEEGTALAATKKPLKCFKCKKTGHFMKDCPKSNKKPPMKNKVCSDPSKALLTALSAGIQQDVWYVDSGATSHMCNNKELLSDYVPEKPSQVSVANGDKLWTAGKGSVCVKLKNCVQRIIRDVYYVPKLSANLLSVSSLVKKGYKVVFNKNTCHISDDEEVLATASLKNGIYQLDIIDQPQCIGRDTNCIFSTIAEQEPPTSNQGALKVTQASQELWHRRLGHLNSRSMSLMKQDVPVTWWQGSRAVLPCVVPPPARDLTLRRPLPLLDETRPRPRQLLWRKDGTEITGKRILPNGTLEVSRRSEGVYQCETFQHGGVVLSLPINLKFASIEKQFTKHPENATVRVGQPFALSCDIKSAPPASLSWLKDGQQLPKDPRYHFLINQLLITDLKYEDSGVYVCIAKNSYAQQSYGGSLEVVDGYEDLEPGLLPVHHEEQVEVSRGSRAILPCPVVGSPRPKLIWEHTPPDGRRSELESTSEVLVLSNIDLDQEGFYSCSVEGNSELVKNFNVTVTIPVNIIEPPVFNGTVNRVVFRASTVRFNCTATGKPEPKITWYKDGVPLVIAGRISTWWTTHNERLQLVISGAISEDAGVYQCFARSGPSSATAWSALAVAGGAAVAPGGLRCSPIDHRRVRLAWSPATTTQIYYLVQYRLAAGTERSVTRQPHPNNEETIPLDESLTPYTFQVRAFARTKNNMSHVPSDLSEEITCQGQGVPIKLVQMYGDTVMVTWEEFAPLVPGVRQWILQYRNGTEQKNVTLAGSVHSYALNAPKSNPLEIRVLGSKTSEWLEQDLSLVPWSSTAKTEDNAGKVIPVPYDVEVSSIESNSFTISWKHDAGEEQGEGEEYMYEVCVHIEEENEDCTESEITSKVIGNLFPETEYEIRVRARELASSRVSDFSAVQYVTTPQENIYGPSQLDNLTYEFINSSTLQVSWNGEDMEYTVHYSNKLKIPMEKWDQLDTKNNYVTISGVDPRQRMYVMVSRHEPRAHSQILTVPPQITDIEISDPRYEYVSSGVQVSWTGTSPATVRYAQNITIPLEQWNTINITGNSIILQNLDLTLPTYVEVSPVTSSIDDAVMDKTVLPRTAEMLTIPPPPIDDYQQLYIVSGILAGILVVVLIAVAAIFLWKRRKRTTSPIRSRTGGSKMNEENGSEMKNVGGRLANGGGSKDAGEPLLNGYVHITENPTPKTPNGKIKRDHLYEATFDVTRCDDQDTTLETVLDADTSASTAYNLLDTSRRPEPEISRSSRDISSNNSFNKLPDDNMNSELTRSTDFDLDSSKIQPMLQPNG